MPDLLNKKGKKDWNKLLKKSGKSRGDRTYGATAVSTNLPTYDPGHERKIYNFNDFVNEIYSSK